MVGRWFKCGGHFDFRLICSCHILILHKGIGFLKYENMFHCQKRRFVTIGWKVINPHILQSILVAILDYKFSTNGILLDFTMSFSIIFCIL